MSAGALNVNVACLACDGTRPCAQCRAVGRALAGAGHRVHRSSRYAALRAAADGTYGFSACVMPLAPGERKVADAIVALLPGARVAIATDDTSLLPTAMPEGFVAFPNADFIAGRLPHVWLDSLKLNTGHGAPERSSEMRPGSASSESVRRSTRSDATRRLRSLEAARRAAPADARAMLDDELAWYRASGIGFALIIIRVGRDQTAHAHAALVRTIRAGDQIAPSDDALAIVMPGVDELHAESIVKRAISSVKRSTRAKLEESDKRSTRAKLESPEPLTFGIALCPRDGDDANSLLATARDNAR